jgi:hypothetical protein
MHPQVTVTSVRDLIGQVRDLRAKTRWRWLFRGQRLASWGLQPRVHREYGAEEERFLTQEFRARAGVRHPHSPRYEDYADWLALMQHYGLPTRLLDWTHSALIAAFFAVEHTLPHYHNRETQPEDSAIWAVCPGELNRVQGLKSYIYPLSSSDLRNLVRRAFYSPRTPSRSDRYLNVAAAMAVETDARMQVQRGAFTIHRTAEPLEMMQGSVSWLRKFVIPGEAVPDFGEEVQALGVGLADLFPDLGSLARDLSCQIAKKANTT